MTRLKKFFFALTVLATMFTIAACNTSNVPSSPSTGTNVPSEPTGTETPSEPEVNKDINMSNITKSSAGLMSIRIDSSNRIFLR